MYIFREITARGLSVRQTEELVRQLYKPGSDAVKTPPKSSLSPVYKKIEDNLASHFGTKVLMKHTKNGAGNISIDYYSLQELNKILELIGIKVQ